jgi:transcription-repair coupling factor (superfamily II helicase)
MLAKIGQGIPVDGMESLAPVLVSELGQISDYLSQDAYIALLSPEKSIARATNLIQTNQEFLHAAWDAAIEGASAPIDLSAGGFRTVDEFVQRLGKRDLVNLTQFMVDEVGQINLNIYETPNFKGLQTEPIDYIADQIKQQQQIVVSAIGHGTAQRIVELLAEAKIPALLTEELPEEVDVTKVYVIQAPLR